MAVDLGNWRETYGPAIRRRTRIIPPLLAGLAVLSLLAAYGFYPTPELKLFIRYANFFVLYAFLFYGVLNLVLATSLRAYMKAHIVEIFILFIIFLHLVAFPIDAILRSFNPNLTAETLTALYLLITQFVVLLAIVPSFLTYSHRLMSLNIQPSLLILLTFLFLIACGTLLLQMPAVTDYRSLSWIDALFTSTSAVCVTGLVVVDTETYFSTTGHFILMALIQIGGLGIMTLTSFFGFVLGGASRLKEYSTMQTLLGEENLGRIRRTVFEIFIITIIFEATGAIAFFYFLRPEIFASQGEHVFFSIFHAVSAFCNAGFALTSENLAAPFLRSNHGVLWIISILVIFGGIGYPVLSDLIRGLTPAKRRRRLSLHTRVVLISTSILLIAGTFFFYLIERNGILQTASTQKILTSFFHSVSARTAGFNTVDIRLLSIPTLFVMIVLMWIGASPGSTGGGVKTTTTAIALLNIFSIASGRNRVELFRRQIADAAITRAFCTILLSFFYLALALFLLLYFEKQPFEQLLFEVVSALSTVGLSTGITPTLTTTGKLILIVTMFVGRVGLLAVVMALTRHRSVGQYQYTTENVLVS